MTLPAVGETPKAAPRGKVLTMPLPIIKVEAGALTEIAELAAKALRLAGVPIYHRGDNTLFRVLRIEKQDGKVRRAIGSVILRPVEVEWLRYQLAGSATFVKWNAKTKASVAVDVKVDLAKTLIATGKELNWPYLRAVVQVPILTEGGEIITKPGYHPESCLLLDLDGEWPVPPAPGKDDAIKARETLEDFMRNFPFAGPADMAVALSATLTVITRTSYPTAPMHAFDAPTAGTGKSLKVDADATLATGKPASVVDWGTDPEEAGKRLDAAQIAGDAIIAIDNVEAPLAGSTLCQMLTQTSRSVRVLGLSKLVTAACTATITATGNNLVLKDDVVRRALVCRMDPQTDRPELRRIDQDLLMEASERRVELVMAALTIVRAYILAGRPDVGIAPLGSFEDWSRTVRAALIWTGSADPCDTIIRSRDLDPSRQEMTAVFTAWRKSFGKDGSTSADAIDRASTNTELHEALAEVCQRAGKLDSRSLGNWLRRHRDTRVGDMVLTDAGTTRHAARWCVRSTTPTAKRCTACDGEGCGYCKEPVDG